MPLWKEPFVMAGFNRIGEILIAKGLVTKDQLVEILEERQGSFFRVGELLVAKGHVTQDDILDCLAQQYNYPVADLSRTYPSCEAMSLLDFDLWYSRPALPIYLRGKTLVCAVPDPFDLSFFEELETKQGIQIEFVLAKATDICIALEAYKERNRLDQESSFF